MSSLLERGRRGERIGDFEIIDIHGHLGRFAFCVPELSAESIVKVMDRIGVGSIVCSHMQCMSSDSASGNNHVLQAMRAHPGRILGYVTLWPADARANRAELGRCLDEGFVGLKLHNASGFDYTDPGYADALALAGERRLPVLLHTWGKAEELQQAAELATSYPGASVLMAHSGAGLNEKGYIELACEHENIYLELAMSGSTPGLVDRLVAGAGAEKVVWGSDTYFLNMAQQVGKVLGARLSEEQKRVVLSENAKRILGRVAAT